MRQAKGISQHLIVGVNNDLDVTKVKASPVLTNSERCKLMKHVKWVDEVYPDSPYSVPIELLNNLNSKYIIHGDDIALDEFGNDVYKFHKQANRFKEIHRLRGVSTTDFIQKLLQISNIRKL